MKFKPGDIILPEAEVVKRPRLVVYNALNQLVAKCSLYTHVFYSPLSEDDEIIGNIWDTPELIPEYPDDEPIAEAITIKANYEQLSLF